MNFFERSRLVRVSRRGDRLNHWRQENHLRMVRKQSGARCVVQIKCPSERDESGSNSTRPFRAGSRWADDSRPRR
jgi:hypothetical protein